MYASSFEIHKSIVFFFVMTTSRWHGSWPHLRLRDSTSVMLEQLKQMALIVTTVTSMPPKKSQRRRPLWEQAEQVTSIVMPTRSQLLETLVLAGHLGYHLVIQRLHWPTRPATRIENSIRYQSHSTLRRRQVQRNADYPQHHRRCPKAQSANACYPLNRKIYFKLRQQ